MGVCGEEFINTLPTRWRWWECVGRSSLTHSPEGVVGWECGERSSLRHSPECVGGWECVERGVHYDTPMRVEVV